MKISIIICTHNPREDYLRRVLDALRGQSLPVNDWELLLVDNASEKPLSASWDISWHPNARHVREEKLGLTHARLRGIAEARGELLIFVDDDNVLRKDYLEACLKISADYPQLGAWSGSCIPEFETEPPEELRPWLAGLVIEKLATPLWARLPKPSEACPMGAGLVTRRKVALRYRELALTDPLRQMLGPGGKFPGAGDDTEMALCGFELGFGTGRFPELELTHLIPARKLNLKFLERLHEGFGHAGVILNLLHQPGFSPRPPRFAVAGIVVKNFLWFAAGKDRIGRKLRVAEEKGKLRAQRTLMQTNFPHSSK